MSSVDTVFFGDFPYYSNLDESRLSVENTTNQFSFSQQFREERNLTKQTSSQKKDESSQLSHFKTPQDQKSKNTPRKITAVSLLPDYLAKKTQSRKQQITIYFFNSQKRICFQREQLNKVFQHRQNVTIKQLINHIVKSYCRLILNFEPLQITPESFQLKLASLENHDDPNIDPFSHDLNIQFLYEADNLVLIRKERPMDKINDWVKLLSDKTENEIIEVLMPQKKQFTIQFQKNRSINALKQKISTFSNQVGKIALVTYYNFKLCENKRKIGDLDEKILQVYRQKVQDYVDRPAAKNATSSFTNVNFYQELWKNPSRNQEQNSTPLEFFVNQTAMFGKLTLSLINTEIHEKYSGGMICSFPFSHITSIFSKSSDQRIRTLSIHTLVGIRNTQNQQLILKFIYKDRTQIITYKFQYLDKKQNFLKSLLKIGRLHNKKWDRIK